MAVTRARSSKKRFRRPGKYEPNGLVPVMSYGPCLIATITHASTRQWIWHAETIFR